MTIVGLCLMITVVFILHTWRAVRREERLEDTGTEHLMTPEQRQRRRAKHP